MCKVEIIDNSVITKCNKCDNINSKPCDVCNGTGEFKREKFILIADNIAFDVDQAGK